MPGRISTHPSSELPAQGPSKPRRTAVPDPVYDDVDMSDSDENDASLARHAPRRLDEPMACTFQSSERVWIRNHDKWIFPRSVPKIGSNDNLTYWNVLYQDSFGHKLRKYFSPLLGELKPDTSAVRSLLREAHWI